MRRRLKGLTLCSLLTSGVSFSSGTKPLETSVCGSIKEPLVFWFWNRMAGRPSPASAAHVRNAKAISYRTVDGRTLRGYKLHSTAGDIVRGSVLLAQGNAMLASNYLQAFADLNDAGLDVYVFDYRGYGESDGKRRLKAIVSDYRELFDNVVPKDAGKRFLYGISFGGIVVSNVIGSGVPFDRAVIDSSPSRLSTHGCEAKYDPAANILADASKLLVIAGEQDIVIPPPQSQELRTVVDDRGGNTILQANFAHPFMDMSYEIHRGRMALIADHLLGTYVGPTDRPDR